MKKYTILFILVSLGFALQAQLLWKITGKNLEKPSYLFGTHHLIPISFLDSVPGLFPAFNECDAVVGEMVLNNIDASAKMMQVAILPDGVTMDSLLNVDDYTLVDNELKAMFKFGLKELGLMNPAIIRTMYELELYKTKTGFSEDEQSDSYFQLVGAQKNKKIIGLEDMDKQIKLLFGDRTPEQEALLLVETIKRKDLLYQEMETLNTLYKAGKINELVLMAKERDEDDPLAMTDEDYAQMVDDRNFDWLEVLPDYMQEQPCFIAVGALHLGGENGLVKQLQKKGFKVTELKAKKK
ncbi:TraB/GumN family protein [Paludibacter sp. 221]|uniref:TraB/GumN family protein n=1 Tax=Paludibacter sp. 221 TaxID=2302939 RepID=UPI0013D0DB4C|nr:TraB/GumN family protein [Paludibacter sp. 221]NDV46990.1 TraB/GumN family protein [Paludibacter sp. 221]